MQLSTETDKIKLYKRDDSWYMIVIINRTLCVLFEATMSWNLSSHQHFSFRFAKFRTPPPRKFKHPYPFHPEDLESALGTIGKLVGQATHSYYTSSGNCLHFGDREYRVLQKPPKTAMTSTKLHHNSQNLRPHHLHHFSSTQLGTSTQHTLTTWVATLSSTVACKPPFFWRASSKFCCD